MTMSKKREVLEKSDALGIENLTFWVRTGWSSHTNARVVTKLRENWNAHLTLLIVHASMWHVDIIWISFGLHAAKFESQINPEMVAHQRVEVAYLRSVTSGGDAHQRATSAFMCAFWA